MTARTRIDLVLTITCLLLLLPPTSPAATGEGLVGHWKLTEDCRDSSGNNNHGVNHGVKFSGAEGAAFDGIDDYIEVPDSESLRPDKGDFSVAVQLHTEANLTDVLGDLLSKYDPATRTGATLGIMNYAGVTSSQSNYRNLMFGIDAARIEPAWNDCGRPGNCRFVFALAVYDGHLYAGTWESGDDETGHVYRYEGGDKWTDCGSPDRANAVAALAVFDGKLYAGSTLYSGGGSALPESKNTNFGGTVYRYDGGTSWTDCGKVADVRAIGGLATFDGKLYAGTGISGAWRDRPRTRGMYRYDGDRKWTSCGCPGLRVVHLAVHNNHLYGLSYDAGGFFRYDGGTDWTQLGPVPETTQVYTNAVYQGRLHVGTWPTGSVFRFDGPQKWAHRGRLGEEKEVMAMAVYNGQLYAGTLPLAEVFRYDGGTHWTSTGQLDTTPEVKYRRAWSMAVFGGRLYCGTLPSGRVYSLEAGKCVTHDRALEPGWRHVAAVKSGGRLVLYVDGRQVATSTAFNPADYDLSNRVPLKIGFGPHDYLNGRLRDLRVYGRTLSETEIRELAGSR